MPGKNKLVKKEVKTDEVADKVDSTDLNTMIGAKSGDQELNPSMIQKHMNELKQLLIENDPMTMSKKANKKTKKEDFQFWKTQPVPDLDEFSEENREISASDGKIRTECYSLPAGFMWDCVDLNKEEELSELYHLLYENYVEDDDHMFRFDYSKEFLQWALMPPGWRPDWHLGLKVAKTKKLVGFIGATRVNMNVHGKTVKMVEINFLCVLKKLRSKRMAPVLIREITRRVNLQGIFQAVYTSGTFLPRPFSVCRYFHRPLNPAKLIAIKFSTLRRNMSLSATVKLYKLPSQPTVPHFCALQRRHLDSAWRLAKQEFARVKVHPHFTREEFEHWFMSRDGIVNAYVVESPEDHTQVTDMCSFYSIPSTVMNNQQYPRLNSAYSFYNFTTKTKITDLVQSMLIMAKQLNYDVFNALNLMDNMKYIPELKFGPGDGDLYYYFYNWLCPMVEPPQLGIVLQ